MDREGLNITHEINMFVNKSSGRVFDLSCQYELGQLLHEKVLARERALIEQIEELKEKAWKYDELCK